MIKYQLDITLYENISLSRDLSVKGGISERCYRTRRGRTDEQRYAIISQYFDASYTNEWPISGNYEYIIFGQIIFQNFHQFN